MSNSDTNVNGHFPANRPIFKGKNYERWCAYMKVIFRFQDVLEIVDEGVPEILKNAVDAQKTIIKE